MPTEASGNSNRTIAAATGSNNVQISRECADGMNLLVVESASVSEFHLTITPRPSESPAAMIRRLAEVLNPLEATVVRQIAFGSVAASQPTLTQLRRAVEGFHSMFRPRNSATKTSARLALPDWAMFPA